MLIELVAICWINANSPDREFIPSTGWVVEKVSHVPTTLSMCAMTLCASGGGTRVTMRRFVKPKETIDFPKGCELTVQPGSDEK